MTRQQAIATIRHEVAVHGRATRGRALRAYIENRVSRAAFDQASYSGTAHAIWSGMNAFQFASLGPAAHRVYLSKREALRVAAAAVEAAADAVPYDRAAYRAALAAESEAQAEYAAAEAAWASFCEIRKADMVA